MFNSLNKFFYPASICLTGASTKEKSLGYELLKTIKEFGFNGKVFPVNPNADEVLGFKCFHSIKDIEEKIDLAIIMVSKKFVEDSVEELLSKGVKSIILITAGFKETGKEGEEIEKKIVKKIKSAGARMSGPNCMGIINTIDSVRLNATFVAEKPEKGSTAFLSQSGAIGAAILNSLSESDIRFGHFISVGNKADISENDLIEFWNNDDNIKTITLYLENFADGELFIKIFLEKRIKKPVIILKAGRTKSGIKAAASHTGALADNDKVVDAVLHQFGIIRVNDLNELFNTSKGFEFFNMPHGNKVAVITNGGGPAILTVDSVEKEGLILSELSDETKIKLKEIVHPEGSINNPVDLLPGGNAEQYKNCIEILLKDDNVDSVISIFIEPVMVDAFTVVEKINSIVSNKPVFQVVMPLPSFLNEYKKNSLTKKPVFKNPEDPAKVISHLIHYSKRNKQKKYLNPEISFDLENKDGFLSIKDIEKLTSHYKIPAAASMIIDKEMIGKVADELEYPVTLKGLSESLIHKSEVGAVKNNIKNKVELLQAGISILDSFKVNKIPLDNFLIQQYIGAKYELLIGGFRDKTFGPIIMFGTGGKYVEVFNDSSIRSAYLSDEDIEEMIYETKAGLILKGVRGENPADEKTIKNLIKNSARMMLDNPSIKEFDFNPVILGNDNSLTLVDIRIRVAKY